MNSRPKLIATIMLALATAVTASAFILYGFHQWPPVRGDAVAYLPPAIYDLSNPIWPAAKKYDPSGEGRLVYHGFVHQLILRLFSQSPSYKMLFILIGCMASASILLTSVAAWICLIRRRTTHLNLLDSCTIALIPLIIASALWSVFDRPEVSVTLILSLCLLVAIARRGLPSILAGAATVLLGFTSPLSSVIFTSLVICYISWDWKNLQFRFWALRYVISALATGTIILAFLYPFGVLDWIRGNLNHASIAVVNRDAANYLSDFLTYATLGPLIMGTSILFATFALSLVAISSESLSFKKISAWTFFMPTLAMGYFGLKVPMTVYNISAFMPVIVVTAALFSTNIAKKLHPRLSALVSLGICAVFLVSTVPIVRSFLLFPSFLHKGMSFDAASNKAANLIKNSKGDIGISLPLFPLTTDSRIQLYQSGEAHTAWLLVAQIYSGQVQPPAIDGYDLYENHFSSFRPTLAGKEIASSPNGYNFAIYKRQD